MTVEEEFVQKSRKVSAGRFLERCSEIEMKNFVRVYLAAAGKD
jgi:hypothetical protein